MIEYRAGQQLGRAVRVQRGVQHVVQHDVQCECSMVWIMMCSGAVAPAG